MVWLFALNSNLILLILNVLFLSVPSFSFKFQSDSINTVISQVSKSRQSALNSNLILLIQIRLHPAGIHHHRFKFQSDSINTPGRLTTIALINSFKFQSDSINTIVCHFFAFRNYSFKFQSDSINTRITSATKRTAETLNSNLILLILAECELLSVCNIFKFQSDSINTVSAGCQGCL